MRVAFSPQKPPKRGRHQAILAIAGILLLGLAGILVPVAKARTERPSIESVDPAIGEPGAMLRVQGRHFGSERGEGRVEFDGAAATSSSYLSWSDSRIELRVPLYAESSLVRVVNGKGRSNARMFMSRALLPSSPAGSGAQALGPMIETLSANSGAIGSELTIRGLNFGTNRGDSDVIFTWMGEAAVPLQSDETGRGYTSPQDASGEYESWSDKEIHVRVPDGAVTGGVAVRTSKGTSQVRYFQVTDMPGTKAYRGRRTYALSSFATISRVKSTGPNSLYLWMPFPAETPSQRGIKTLNRTTEPLLAEYRGLSAYRLVDLQPDRLVSVGHDHIVQVYGIETDVKVESIKAVPSNPSRLYAMFTEADLLVPSDDPAIRAFARKVAGKEKNQYRIASAALAALAQAVKFDAGAVSIRPADALASAKADSWDMALLYTAILRAAGVPALPVAGVVVDGSRRAWNHAWVEFYVYGFGWIPVDPVLVSGATVGGFVPPFTDRSRYFGNMDDMHIAFSRGLAKVDRMAPDGRTVAAARRYSFQNIFEEAGGDLPSYTSFWSDVEITGVY